MNQYAHLQSSSSLVSGTAENEDGEDDAPPPFLPPLTRSLRFRQKEEAAVVVNREDSIAAQRALLASPPRWPTLTPTTPTPMLGGEDESVPPYQDGDKDIKRSSTIALSSIILTAYFPREDGVRAVSTSMERRRQDTTSSPALVPVPARYVLELFKGPPLPEVWHPAPPPPPARARVIGRRGKGTSPSLAFSGPLTSGGRMRQRPLPFLCLPPPLGG